MAANTSVIRGRWTMGSPRALTQPSRQWSLGQPARLLLLPEPMDSHPLRLAAGNKLAAPGIVMAVAVRRRNSDRASFVESARQLSSALL